MNADVASVLLATGAAGLLAGGGALLHSVFSDGLDPEANARWKAEMDAERAALELTLRGAEEEVERLRRELDRQTSAAEAQREETIAARQRLEHRSEAAEAEARRALDEVRDVRQQAADLEKQAAESRAERDAIKAKTEALERLVEGVRARSRELARELGDLKAATKPGP